MPRVKNGRTGRANPGGGGVGRYDDDTVLWRDVRMLRFLLPLVGLLALSGVSQGHFLWLIPGEKPNTVKLVFSDKLAPDVDNAQLIDKVKQSKLFVHDPGAKHVDLKLEKDTAAWLAAHPDKTHVVRGSCVYGVFQRGDSPAQLLNYYCILKRGELTDSGCFHCQPFQVREEKPGVFLVEFEGDPAVDSEVVLVGSEGFKELKGKTDKEGRVTFDLANAPKGLYGLRARHIVKEPGELDGKKYAQVANYVTLVFER
jgi:hypothetical protein